MESLLYEYDNRGEMGPLIVRVVGHGFIRASSGVLLSPFVSAFEFRAMLLETIPMLLPLGLYLFRTWYLK